ncbi:Rad51-like protein [Scenedesmus sp. NREL 46B-D3]|nr:Rad51-like protein [Scenedesmus sp. NREL 46B-D3]
MAEQVAMEQAQVQGEDEMVVDDFQEIEALAELGVSAADVKKAKEGGFYTIQSLIMNPRKQRLHAVKGLSEAKADKMVEAAKKLTTAGSWISGAEAMQKRAREIVKVTTGAAALDTLLGGGMETKAITELYGEYRTGKTQLCHTLCVAVQLPITQGGGAGKAAYVDTEGTFRPERIRAIAARFNLDPDAVLDNIVVGRAHTVDGQMELLQAVGAKMVEEPYKLLIVDSIMALFRTDFTGRGELAERQQKLGQMMALLKKISEEFNVAVVVTNQVMSDPGGGMTFVADPKKPVGGHVMAHASTQRLYLRKGKGEQRVAKVVDSPCLAEGEASFALSDDGVVEYKE